ncbi:enoyl-CoA hydratase/isomerase family protein [Orrella sp. 11846]|uniref:enoyl-CoA hydratase/isomerase family protein n=1 Tax=Orrella sp. 11846 TaxID=3409913 RepID=UPI003B5B286A
MNTETQKPGGRIITEHHGPVTVLKFDYPERRNALSMPIRELLSEALKAAIADENCRAIVLTGEGAHFSSGGDISSFDNLTAISGRRRMRKTHDLIVETMIACEKPIIAAVEGHAAGAGMCVAANCDIAIAAEGAKFTCSFNKIGLLPDLGGLWSIPQRVGLGRAKLLMMTGRMIDAKTALSYGLVEEVCEDGKALETAIALGQEIAQTAPLSNGFTKNVLARGPLTLEELLDAETDMQGLLFGSEDFREGRDAFMEKRKPQFKGR